MKIRLSASNGVTIFEGDLELPLVIGRRSECNVVVTDDSISGRHVELTMLDGKVLIRDLQSKNGTYLGDQRVSETTLVPPISLKIGIGIKLDIGEKIDDGTKMVLQPMMASTPLSEFIPKPAAPLSPPRPSVMLPAKKHVAEFAFWEYLNSLTVLGSMRFLVLLFGLAIGGRIYAENLTGTFPLIGLVGSQIALALGSLIIATVIAGLGYFFRGEFSLKPVFLVFVVSSWFWVQLVELDPYIFAALGNSDPGLVGGIEIALRILLTVCSLFGAYVIALALVSHHWRKCAQFSIVLLCALVCFGNYIEYKKSHDRKTLLVGLVSHPAATVRRLAGANVSAKIVADDIRRFKITRENNEK